MKSNKESKESVSKVHLWYLQTQLSFKVFPIFCFIVFKGGWHVRKYDLSRNFCIGLYLSIITSLNRVTEYQ